MVSTPSHPPLSLRAGHRLWCVIPFILGQPARDLSPSPDPRDRQRTIKAQSLPLVPPLSQIYPNLTQPNARQPMQQTSTNPIRRGSPPITSNGSVSREDDESVMSASAPAAGARPPPPPMHTASSSNIHDAVASKPPVLPHSQSQPNIMPHAHPRPINRAVPPAFIDKNWELTAEFLAEIESADFQQSRGIVHASPSSGTAGLAYAGGASSNSNLPASSRTDQGTPPREATLDRTRGVNDHFGVEQANNRRRERGRESPKPRVITSYPQQPSSQQQQQQQGQARTPDRSSPQFTSPLNTPGEHPAPSYAQFKRVDNYPRVPSPLSGRRGSLSNTDPPRTTPPAGNHRNIAQTPPLYTQKTRGTPDKSLPVQEQEEGDDDRPHEDWNRRGQQDSRSFSSPVPSTGARSDGYDRDARQSREAESRPLREDDLAHQGRDLDDRPPQPRSGRNSRQAHREDDDDETLINTQTEDQDDDHHDDDDNTNPRDRSDGDDSGTPRSPTADLVDHRGGLYHNPAAAQSRAVLPLKHRNGALDRFGLQGFPDPTSFSMPPPAPKGRRPLPQMNLSATSSAYDDSSSHLPMGHKKEYPDDWQSYMDDPTTAYLQAYLQSPRPPAPTPGITTNPVPSPSPMVSATPSEAGGYAQPHRPVGSPYPFPFDHVRRQNIYSSGSYAAPPSAPPPDSGTGSYDPNDPAAIEAQLALQAQMYALNNYAATSDVTLSPSGTPFPHAGQNPWAFLQARMNLMGLGGGLGIGRQRLDSIRSSPSHEPLPLPRPPPIRGRNMKKRGPGSSLRDGSGMGNGVNKKGGVQVPPRVDSTQPRDTSPEPSSGEETSVAGEHDILDEPIVDNIQDSWTGAEDDWIDEDEDGDEEDFIELEYHPSYITNVDKRRRRWETKLEALSQTVSYLCVEDLVDAKC
jgi:hypothetical protein